MRSPVKSKHLHFWLAMVFSLFFVTACGSGGAGKPGQDAKKAVFPSKDITFVVPYSPGGGFDTNARLLAPFLQKNLPNKVNVVVKNVPGGECRIGINEIYKAAPDGHTMGIFNLPGNVTGQILGKVEYDLNRITWIGRMTDTVYLACMSPKSRLKGLDDLRAAGAVKVGIVGFASSASLSTVISAQEMGFRINPINHDGSQEAVMSAIRGDVDMVVYPYSSMRKFVVDSKDLKPMWIYSEKRAPDLPDVPTVVEMGYPQLLEVVRSDIMIGATPGLPEDAARILREAFQKAMADPDLKKMLNDAKQPANPTDDKQAMDIVSKTFQGYAKYKDLIQQYTSK